MCFKRHPDGRWGLEPQRWPDGRSDFWRPLDEQDKPWLLRGQDHGTQVVLLGQHERHDTTQAPESVTDGPPAMDHPLPQRPLPAPPRRRSRCSSASSTTATSPDSCSTSTASSTTSSDTPSPQVSCELSDAIAHWWVLDDDHRARRREATLWASTGHAAAVHGDELYDVLPQTRGGYGRLQDFGIRFGYERVVLHLQPQVQAGRLECNTARTLLLLDHEPLPWARWGEEFTAAMPDEIRQLQERAASADGIPRQKAIRSRVSAIMPLYRLSRYRPTRPPRQPSPPGRARTAPRDGRVGRAVDADPGARHTRRPRTRCTALADAESAPRRGRRASPRQTDADGPSGPTRLWICPTSRGSPHATAPERRATSRTRPPATTPAATS